MTRRLLFRPREAVRRHLTARLDAQERSLAEMRLALDEAVLALDRRMLDHYALTELALADARLRADAIDSGIKDMLGAGGSIAELLATESMLFDGYLVHHIAELRRDLGVSRGAASPSAPGLDLLVLAGDYDLVVPSVERGLVAYLLRHGFEAIEPGVRAVLARELQSGGAAVDEAPISDSMHSRWRPPLARTAG